MIRAVVFDVGGPLDTEIAFEAAIDAGIRAALAGEGYVVDDAAYAEAVRWAVEHFAPSLYRPVIWFLTSGNAEASLRIYDSMEASAAKRELFEQREGIGKYFENPGVSGVYGFRKPDVRLFLKACADLAVEPHECVMVGDRGDNDIVPARSLGMRTVLLRTGRHIAQQARSWDERPDVEVHTTPELLPAILSLLDEAP